MINYLPFGGGVSSTALMFLLLEEGVEFEAVFCDLAGELPETYEHIENLRNKGFQITTIPTNYMSYNSLYDYCWFRKIIPGGMGMKWCSLQFKRNPLFKYYKKPCTQFLGFDSGEKHRAIKREVPGIITLYPLVEKDIDRNDCARIIRRHSIKLPPKSGCFFCPNQRKAGWKKLSYKHPDLFQKAIALEDRHIEQYRSIGKRFHFLAASRPLRHYDWHNFVPKEEN